MNHFFLTVLFVFSSFFLLAQPSQTLRGRVMDRESKCPLVGATVQLLDNTSKPITGIVAGSRGEPARMASNFAGVQGADDSRNDIVIRGNSPSGLLWRVEGINIPNPNHFAIPGTSGGPVSIIRNDTLANSDFFTGAFPAEFGNGIAGVFDLKLRNGNNERHQRSLQFGFLGTEGLLEGPLSKKSGASYLITYRYANLWLFGKAGIDINTQAVPTYQDASFRFSFPLKSRNGTPGGRLALWGFGGTSTVDILVSEQSVADRNIFGQNDRDQYYTSRRFVSGLTLCVVANQPDRKTGSQRGSYQHGFHAQPKQRLTTRTPRRFGV